jgi:hypothetical protein
MLRLFAIDNWPQQFFQQLFATIATFGCRGQAQSERRNRQFSHVTKASARQVMALVADQQPELIAQALHKPECRGIGRHCERADFKIAAADQTDLGFEGGEQQVIPLIHQVKCRHNE